MLLLSIYYFVDRQWLWDQATKYAVWQHPAVWHGVKLAVPHMNCYVFNNLQWHLNVGLVCGKQTVKNSQNLIKSFDKLSPAYSRDHRIVLAVKEEVMLIQKATIYSM